MSWLPRLLAAAIAASAASSPLQAAWHEAKSKHFIIYADDSAKAVQDYATRLEKFDAAARTILQMPDPVVGDGNRLTVFVLPHDGAVRKLAGDKTGFLKGFYVGRASGPLAYVPRQTAGGLSADAVFFHEYAHHLMLQQLDRPYPLWFVEGFAEFLSSPEFKKDGSVGLGAVPQARARGLFNSRPLPLETLLGGNFDIAKLSTEQRESIYGRGWLLAHYLYMGGKRGGQLDRYMSGIVAGRPPLDAARAAFGDLATLDRELTAYLNQRRIMTFNIAPAGAQPGPIAVRALGPGAARVLPLRATLRYRVPNAELPRLVEQVRVIQAQYPGDELVERTLAEAELAAGQHAAAEAAADRAIALDPQSTDAIVLKGKAVMARALAAPGDAAKAISDAQDLFIRANKIDPEDPEPLLEFYKSYVRGSRRPTANAIKALHYASDLAPQDLAVRMNSAVAYLADGKPKDARRTLVPVAYSPHGGPMAEQARRMIARIDAGDAQGPLAAPRGASARDPD